MCVNFLPFIDLQRKIPPHIYLHFSYHPFSGERPARGDRPPRERSGVRTALALGRGGRKRGGGTGNEIFLKKLKIFNRSLAQTQCKFWYTSKGSFYYVILNYARV